jgi:3-hydroxybutyryl-CoA dehydrogenase
MKISIIGAGQMGSGIAQVCAMGGHDVLLYDISKDSLERGISSIQNILKRSEAKGKITAEQHKKVFENITTTTTMGELKNSDFVIEAATENIDLKLNIFKEIDKIVSKSTIIASNTSSISITKLAFSISESSRFIGMHFMNPVPVMKLVEIIRGLQTSEETLKRTIQLAEQVGKITTLSNDVPGFIANRILMPYINEAIQALYENVGTVEAIDTTMKLGTNVPMGPLTLADFIGLDTCLAIMNVLNDGFRDSKYRPSPLLVKYVEAGWLGKKSGKGFYTYE